MKLQEELPRSLCTTRKKDEHGLKNPPVHSESFFTFCHFEREMEKNIELANVSTDAVKQFCGNEGAG